MERGEERCERGERGAHGGERGERGVERGERGVERGVVKNGRQANRTNRGRTDPGGS
jgi:hypothetical protein